MNDKPQVERRRATRRTTRIEAVLQHGLARSHVMILDFEKQGLNLWVRDRLLPETEVNIHVAGYDLKAKVQWHDRKTAGVQLLQPLDHDLRRMFDAARETASY